jgi:hypothetical protein
MRKDRTHDTKPTIAAVKKSYDITAKYSHQDSIGKAARTSAPTPHAASDASLPDAMVNSRAWLGARVLQKRTSVQELQRLQQRETRSVACGRCDVIRSSNSAFPISTLRPNSCGFVNDASRPSPRPAKVSAKTTESGVWGEYQKCLDATPKSASTAGLHSRGILSYTG